MQKKPDNGVTLIANLRKWTCWRRCFCARTNNGNICTKSRIKDRNTAIGLIQSILVTLKPSAQPDCIMSGNGQPDRVNTANGNSSVSTTQKSPNRASFKHSILAPMLSMLRSRIECVSVRNCSPRYKATNIAER